MISLEGKATGGGGDDERSGAAPRDGLSLTLLGRGLLLLLFGTVAFFYPFMTLFALATLIAIVALADGLLLVVTGAIALRRGPAGAGWLDIVRGLSGLVIGAFFLLMPFFATAGLSILALGLLSAWAAVNGVREIAAAFRTRGDHRQSWLLAAWGILLLLLGLLVPILLVSVPQSFVGLAWVLSIYAWFTGLGLVFFATRLRFLARRSDAPAAKDDHRS